MLLYLSVTLPKLEAFITEAIPFQGHPTGFWCNNVSLGAEVRKGWKELGPLLLFNPLWTTALHDTAWFMIRLSDYFVFIYIPVS
jgi:hypothetical protein